MLSTKLHLSHLEPHPFTFNLHTFLILLVCYNCVGVNCRNSYAFHISTIVTLSLSSVEEGHDPIYTKSNRFEFRRWFIGVSFY